MWGSEGEFNYLEMAKKYSRAIMMNLVSDDGRLLLGDWVQDSDFYCITRSSDLLVRNLYAFRNLENNNEDKWTQVIAQTQTIINTLFTEYSNGTGLIPDFIRYQDKKYAPVDGYILESEYDGDYNYNACRTPWRIGQYALYSDTKEYDEYLLTFSKWSKKVTKGTASNFNSGYLITSGTPGEPILENDWIDMSFIAPLIIPASLSQDVQWYNMLYQYLDETSMEENSYFGNTIRMQVLIDATGMSLH